MLLNNQNRDLDTYWPIGPQQELNFDKYKLKLTRIESYLHYAKRNFTLKRINNVYKITIFCIYREKLPKKLFLGQYPKKNLFAIFSVVKIHFLEGQEI